MCGIAGYTGNNFNKYKFNILGLYNDTRGGDSCGIFVNNNGNKTVHYGFDKTKLYKNFVESNGLKNIDLDSPNLALLHCRKASIGGIGLIQAQPVIIKDNNGDVVFSMIHNGTLVNYEELAKKYDVEYALTDTDSQIFCKTVFKAGYGVLAEYDGAGAFVFWDKRDGENTIKLFKGASLYYEDDDTLYIERPLYCINDKNSYWFSSIKESLEFINDTYSEITDIKSNVLFTIKDGEIIAEDKIDRSNRKQSDKLAIDYEKRRQLAVYKPPYYGEGQGRFDWDAYYEEESPRGNYGFARDNSGKADSLVECTVVHKNKIHYKSDGLYYLNDILCDGAIEASSSGYTDITGSYKNMYYFVSGILMSSYFDYLCAKQFVNQNFPSIDDECVEMYLCPYSPMPIAIMWPADETEKTIEFYSYNDALKDSELFDGFFEPFFSFKRDRYIVRMGSITWHYEYYGSSFYVMPKEKQELDKKILTGEISKNQLKKMIRKNLRTVYARI